MSVTEPPSLAGPAVSPPREAEGSLPPAIEDTFGGAFSPFDQGRDSPAGFDPPHHRRRWVIAGLVALALVALGVVAGTRLGRSGGGNTSTNSADNAYPTSLATVKQEPISAQTDVSATLGYAGSYSAVNQASGTVTSLPAVGQVVTQGQPLYEVNAAPVVLLYGTTPAYRSMSNGMTGPDVEELNADLVALGDATASQLSPTSDAFSSATETALEKLQAALGVTQSGSLTLGQAVFLPGALRVTTVAANLGGSAQPGMAVLSGTSTSRQVSIALDAAQQSEIKVGDKAVITLPDNTTVAGTVSSVGTVAVSPSNSGAGPASGNSAPTITVDVTPTNPSATGTFDQAPVSVAITTDTIDNALVVPVNALLALSTGGYAVEVVDAGGAHHLVPVSTGLFDDAHGVVQVQGSGLAAGQQIVIPAA